MQVIKIVSCGLSFYCSQKIHNLLKGITLVNREADKSSQKSPHRVSKVLYVVNFGRKYTRALSFQNFFGKFRQTMCSF